MPTDPVTVNPATPPILMERTFKGELCPVCARWIDTSGKSARSHNGEIHQIVALERIAIALEEITAQGE